jgi:hypothetical protein
MRKGSSYCFECKRLLVEIDNRGHRLRGCLTCNIWWSLRASGTIKLSVEDLQALQQLRWTKPSDGSIFPRPKGKARYVIDLRDTLVSDAAIWAALCEPE